MKIELCSFSGYKIYPGHGKRLVKTDGKVFQFMNSKCESSHLMRRNPRKTIWTVLYRRKHKKGSEVELAKKRRRKTTKFQRAIVGASLNDILAKRNMNPEVRKAQREQAVRAAKEKQRSTKGQKKAVQAGQKTSTQKAKQAQKAPKPVMAKAPRVGGKR